MYIEIVYFIYLNNGGKILYINISLYNILCLSRLMLKESYVDFK